MKAGAYARIVFGLSAILCGVVTVVWHDSDAWQHTHALAAPAAPVLVWIVGAAQVVGGFALLLPRTTRFGALLLSAVYLLTTLACLIDIVPAPTAFGGYVDFGEQLSVACGAFAAYAMTERTASRSRRFGRVARIGFGLCAISFAWAQVAYFAYTASLVPTWIPPNPAFWTVVTTVAFALAALAILIDRQARLALRLMTLMVALFGLLVWVPRLAAHPATLSNWNEIGTNFLIAGAAWLIAELKSF